MRGTNAPSGALNVRAGNNYVSVTSSVTTSKLQISTGSAGDYLAGVLLVPSSVSPGAVTLTDGTTAMPIFAGGTTSVSNLVSFFVPVGANSVSGPWLITTGSTITAIAVGDFS